MSEQTEPGRERSLDALRGIAAVNVLVLHFLTVFWLAPFPNHERWAHLRTVLERTPLALLWAGDQAVLLFFALSGFALYRLLEGQRLSVPAYYVRRFFRLWVPYAFSIMLGLLSVSLVEPTVFRASIWLDPKAPNPISAGDVAEHLLMVGQFNTFKINGVIWSLVHEMRMSIVFPAIYLALQRWHPAAVLALSLGLAALAVGFEKPAFVPEELSSWWRTLFYQAYFVMGATLAHCSPLVSAIYRRIPSAAAWALGIVGLVLYSDMLHVLSKASVFVGVTTIMVAALWSARVRALLYTWPLPTLGRISFSLYLLHRLVLVTTANLLYPRLGLATIAAVALPLAFVAAHLAYRLVEAPANRLGRSLAASMASASFRARPPAR